MKISLCLPKTLCTGSVNGTGRLAPAFAFGGTNAQRRLFAQEGVAFDEEGKVLPEYFWRL